MSKRLILYKKNTRHELIQISRGISNVKKQHVPKQLT